MEDTRKMKRDEARDEQNFLKMGSKRGELLIKIIKKRIVELSKCYHIMKVAEYLNIHVYKISNWRKNKNLEPNVSNNKRGRKIKYPNLEKRLVQR